MTGKKGLVLEGGAMRGLWTAGVTDVMMEHDIWPDGLIGVSAGAAFGCNYKSRQIGRAIRYNTRFAKDARYSGMRSLLTSGDYFNAKFGYHVVPYQYDIFDIQAFEQNPLEFTIVCTDVETGKPVYHKMDHVDHDELEWLRASASMPLASKVVRVGGRKLLDGGVGDSIPLAYFEKQGYHRNIVILTQPRGFRKRRTRLMPVIRLAMRRYPAIVEAMNRRHEMYNAQLDYLLSQAACGTILLIQPQQPLNIGRTELDAGKMQRVYDLGRHTGTEYLPRIIEFLSGK